jgi:glycerol-3-phosphate dehydrogenase subunit B
VAITDDVLVIGGGIAACTAAFVAARKGATTRLVASKASTLRHASGLIDVLGYGPGGEGPLVTPYPAFDDLPDEHPYAKVGASRVQDALDLFDEVVGDAYRGGHTDRNALLPTHGGTVKPTARYPAAAAAGLASDARPMLVVGLRELTDFDGRQVADHLEAAGVPFPVAGVEVSFPGEFRADARITRYARALDADEREGDGVGTREALAARVEPHLDDVGDGVRAERVGFPAMLGDDAAAAVRADLSRRLDADVFEVPAGPPSLPGLRLEDLLYEALDEAGVRMDTGNPAVGFDSRGGRVTAVRVDRGRREVPYAADQYVLATGGLVGKGLDSDREGVREPLFDCHVPAPGDRYDWFVDDAFGDQPFARFGVRVDGGMRPLGADGRPEFANLRAAGAVLGGGDFAAEKSMSGVSLASGLVAGRTAAASL